MLSRRLFLRLSTALGGSVTLSTALSGCMTTGDRPGEARFAHGVASGDPLADGLLLWTRATPATQVEAMMIGWELAADRGFERPLRSGMALASAEHDFTVKVDVRDLEPGREYFYRFLAADGVVSATGRGRTLPRGSLERLRLAVCSCANYPAGLFHAYREISRLPDLDATVHLGDYLYEYGAGGYGTRNAEALGRALPADNDGELLVLEDYRRRYALYRSDADLQAFHAAAPCIAVWDDHEVANDSWQDGAENHNEGEGSFEARKLAAVRAYYEWMPIRPPAGPGSERIYRSFEFGDLAALHMLDTRLIDRSRPLDYRDYRDGRTGALDGERFRRDLLDPSRGMLGEVQLGWLLEGLGASTATWQVLGQQVIMGAIALPGEVLAALGAEPSYAAHRDRFGELVNLKERLLRGETLDPVDFGRLREPAPYNLDAWDGYPVERERLLRSVQALGKRLITLAGDTHNAWHGTLRAGDGTPVGTEFAAPSVSSPGMETYLTLSPDDAREMARAVTTLVDDLHYCNLDRRGFLQVDFSHARVEAKWHYLDTVRARRYESTVGYRVEVPA